MSNLISEQRPDKNGKIVTRHVRPDGGTSLSASSIPAPSIAPKIVESPSEAVMRVLREHDYSEMPVEDFGAHYLEAKGEVTTQVFADAMLSARDERDVWALSKVVTIGMEPGVVQLAANDIGFILDVAEVFPAEKPIFSLRKAIDAVESTFVSTFRPNGKQSDHTKTDYLKHAEAFRAHMVARVLGINDMPETVFEAQEQVSHIQENLEAFRKHLPACAEVVNALYQVGVKTNSVELLKAVGYLEENPDSLDAIVTVARERKRFDADEIETVLSSANAISQGAL